MVTRSRPLIGLRFWRKQYGYTQEKLADLIGYGTPIIEQRQEASNSSDFCTGLLNSPG
jgi:hypothetical protein